MSKKEVMPERVQDLIELFQSDAITKEEFIRSIKERGFEVTYKLDEENHVLSLSISEEV
jgi:hypothetical protein